MRWTFDPYAVRNAHFNLTVLGATGIRFLPDYYGKDTDRVLVSWDLTGPPARGPVSRTVPAADRARLRQELAGAFAGGGRLVGVGREPVAYHFAGPAA
jgi:predicted GNAT superfamily acetyltransferase